MPRFFFDVLTVNGRIRDEVGIELRDQTEIWPEIARLVHDCLPEVPSTAEGRLFDVTIRDLNDAVVERCTTSKP